MFGIPVRWPGIGVRVLLLSLTAFLASGREPGRRITKVQQDDVLAHRLTTPAILHTRLPSGDTSVGARLHVVVSASGQVESANVWNLDNPDEQWAREQAEAAEKLQRFRPFRHHGHPVPASFDDVVWIVPPIEWADTHTPFPEISNGNSLRMTIERTACYGMCPSYSLEVRGNGDVFFDGKGNVPARGHFHTRISHETVDHVLASFRNADYLSLKNEYAAMITDNPTCITSIQFDNVRKSVRDYVGFAAGMPEVVWQVERDMDQIARRQGWIR